MEGGRWERKACGPSKFSIPRTSQDKLQLELLTMLFFGKNNNYIAREELLLIEIFKKMLLIELKSECYEYICICY